ncbi:MAG: nuclear transport factor 2 family protein [Acidimicrobiales bacterium]|nr:nuclear transport factor 2 family protein [Acidimicrobiales bacterium]
MVAAPLDAHRARNLAAVEGAFAGIGAGDAARQLEHYTDDLVIELPYASPPRRVEGKDAALAYLGAALGAFELDLVIDEVHAGLDPDELVVEFSGTGRHRPTGSAYANRYIAVFGFRDGRIVRQREYYNPAASPTGGA